MSYKNRINKIKKKKGSGLKFIAIFLILAIIISVASFSVRQITNSGFFEIKRIKIKGDTGWLEKSVAFLLKKNLLNADLGKAEKILRREHPEIETVVISKLWPDTVYIRFTLKRPLAMLEGSELLIDKNGFLLAASKYNGSAGSLPLIYGLTRGEFHKTGRLNSDEKLVSAIAIIQLFSRAQNYGNYRLTKVDVSKVSESAFYIDKKCVSGACAIKVNVGEDSYWSKLGIFKIFLKKADFDWSNVNYIDLRFKEPIVGLKNG